MDADKRVGGTGHKQMITHTSPSPFQPLVPTGLASRSTFVTPFPSSPQHQTKKDEVFRQSARATQRRAPLCSPSLRPGDAHSQPTPLYTDERPRREDTSTSSTGRQRTERERKRTEEGGCRGRQERKRQIIAAGHKWEDESTTASDAAAAPPFSAFHSMGDG